MVRLPKKKTDFFFLFLFMKLGLPGVLFVGGAALSDKGGEASTSRRDGLTAWRVLSDAPHYKLLTDIDSDQSLVSN